jgi:hypothetical protein
VFLSFHNVFFNSKISSGAILYLDKNKAGMCVAHPEVRMTLPDIYKYIFIMLLEASLFSLFVGAMCITGSCLI